jgi:magnesium chelatase family protein
MVQRVSTVSFEGVEVRPVDVQVQVAPGMPAFTVVGLPDKAVSEARERVRSAMIASGLALPARRITVNLAPADLPKEGSHYDLPIALGLMAAIGAIPHDALSGFAVLGELGLDGSIAAVAGVLPAAIGANARGEGLICPAACGLEAAWASPEIEIVAASSLIQLANHFKGTQVLSRPQPKILEAVGVALDLADIKGQESAKRALEVAAAGGHNLLMVGPPGAGKSMLAARLPSILPPLAPAELLEVSMVASVAGAIKGGAHQPAAVPRPAPLGQHAGAGRRRIACAAGRNIARAPRRAVPRRAGGIPAAGARRAAPAARDRRGCDCARQPSGHLPGALHAGRGDESVPLRACQRARLRLPPRRQCALRGRLPGAHFRPAH